MTQTCYNIYVKFGVVNKINFSLLVHHHLHAARIRQNGFELWSIVAAVELYLRQFGIGGIATFVVDKCIFYVAFAQFQPAFRRIKIGVNLVVCAFEIGTILEQNLAYTVRLCDSAFDFGIIMRYFLSEKLGV